MAKPRYKVVPLRTLKAGDTFWALTSGRAIKGGFTYRTPRVPYEGQVLYHTAGGVKVKILEFRHLGFVMVTSKDRQVFVEVPSE